MTDNLWKKAEEEAEEKALVLFLNSGPLKTADALRYACRAYLRRFLDVAATSAVGIMTAEGALRPEAYQYWASANNELVEEDESAFRVLILPAPPEDPVRYVEPPAAFLSDAMADAEAEVSKWPEWKKAHLSQPEAAEAEAAGALLDVLDGFTKAYPLDIFPEVSADEREWLRGERPGLQDRIAASMGRHFAKFSGEVRDEIKRLQAENAALRRACGSLAMEKALHDAILLQGDGGKA